MASDSQTIDWGNVVGQGAGALVNYLGTRASTNALTGAEQQAIGTQGGVQGQLQDIYAPQRGLGNTADVGLASQLGLVGQGRDYSSFYNSPGFQFSLGLGNQSIQRTAAANGSLYTPNELAMLSQYNTGYASQNYNNYMSQLIQAAGLGGQGNQGLAQGIYGTGANISQLQQNQGNARASGAANVSGVASNLISKVPWGSVYKSVTSGGGSNGGAPNASGGGTSQFIGGYNDYNSATGQGNFSNNSLFDNYAAQNGYDPTTGTYGSNAGGYSFNNFSNSTGYDPTTGDYSGNNWNTGGQGSTDTGNF